MNSSSPIAKLASDGIFDQPGQESRRAFGPKRFTETIEENRQFEAKTLVSNLAEKVTKWRGTEVRRDDLSAIAITL